MAKIVTWAEHLAALKEHRVELVRRAKEAQQDAINWRGFKVGAAVLAYSTFRDSLPEFDAEHDKRYRFYTGANLMPMEGDKDAKICAEPVAVMSAIRAKFDLIVAICIVAVPQIDDTTKLPATTLHPCRGCRIILKALPVMTPETRVITMAPEDGGPMEEHSFEELLAKHNGHGNGGHK